MKVNGELKNAQVEAVTNTAARPAAGQDGRVLYDIALGQLIYDNGTTWEVLPNTETLTTKYQIKSWDDNLSVGGGHFNDSKFYNIEAGIYRITYNITVELDLLYLDGALDWWWRSGGYRTIAIRDSTNTTILETEAQIIQKDDTYDGNLDAGTRGAIFSCTMSTIYESSGGETLNLYFAPSPFPDEPSSSLEDCNVLKGNGILEKLPFHSTTTDWT
jgi:hypothetical protein